MAEVIRETLFSGMQRFANDLIGSWPQTTPMGRMLRAARSIEDIRSTLLTSPKEVMAEFSVSFPRGLDIKFLENSERNVHVVLPSTSRIDAIQPKPSPLKINPIKALVVQSCSNPDLRQRLLREPPVVLTLHGLTAPEGAVVTSYENTDQKVFVLLPAKERPEVIEMRNSITVGKVSDTPRGIELEWREPGYLLVGGTADSATVTVFRRELDRMKMDLDLDLSRVKFFSSQGIGLLVRAQNRMALLGCRIRFISVPQNLLKVLGIFRLLETFEIEDHTQGDLMNLYHP